MRRVARTTRPVRTRADRPSRRPRSPRVRPAPSGGLSQPLVSAVFPWRGGGAKPTRITSVLRNAHNDCGQSVGEPFPCFKRYETPRKHRRGWLLPMTTNVITQRPDQLVEPAVTRRRGRWIEQWDPDDEQFWAASGRRIARKNLALSMFAEHIGFCVWVLWTIVVLNLGNAGISLAVSELFLLTFVPNVVGSFLRIPYTFAIPRFGGRAWTAVSASLLLIPTSLLAFLVPSGWLAAQAHGTQLWVLVACAATAGLGGGNFSSSMANISFFYPERHKGFALGLNAAGGNLGVAVAQLLVPLVVIIGVPAAAVKLPLHRVHLANAGLIWLPLI